MNDLSSAPLPPLSADDHVRGPADAPLVVLYADFTCPRCAVAHERLRGAALRIAFRHFALRAKHPRAVPLACAAEAADRQGRFWEMCDSLFAEPGRIDDPHLWQRAERLGLDVARFDADRRAADAAERVQRDLRGGMRFGVAVTPTLVAGTELHAGPPSDELLARLSRASAPDRRVP